MASAHRKLCSRRAVKYSHTVKLGIWFIVLQGQAYDNTEGRKALQLFCVITTFASQNAPSDKTHFPILETNVDLRVLMLVLVTVDYQEEEATKPQEVNFQQPRTSDLSAPWKIGDSALSRTAIWK